MRQINYRADSAGDDEGVTLIIHHNIVLLDEHLVCVAVASFSSLNYYS